MIDCRSEQAFFAQREIWTNRAKRPVVCDAIVARLARFITRLQHALVITTVSK
jgi:hypothetical protein